LRLSGRFFAVLAAALLSIRTGGDRYSGEAASLSLDVAELKQWVWQRRRGEDRPGRMVRPAGASGAHYNTPRPENEMLFAHR
jgi:hypothetical protein